MLPMPRSLPLQEVVERSWIPLLLVLRILLPVGMLSRLPELPRGKKQRNILKGDTSLLLQPFVFRRIPIKDHTLPLWMPLRHTVKGF